MNPKLDQIEQKIKNVQDSMSRMNSMVKIFGSKPPTSAVHHRQGIDGRTPDAALNGTGESRSCGGCRERHLDGLGADQLTDHTLWPTTIATEGLTINHPEASNRGGATANSMYRKTTTSRLRAKEIGSFHTRRTGSISAKTTEACSVAVRGPPRRVSVSGVDPVPRGIAVRRTVGVSLATPTSSLPSVSLYPEVFTWSRTNGAEEEIRGR